MKKKILMTVATASAVLALAIPLALAEPPAEPAKAHAMSCCGGGGDGAHAGMQAMTGMDARLDQLVAAMNAAEGTEARLAATQAVVAELVAQRQAMHQRMAGMHSMMQGMHGEKGGHAAMAGCPMHAGGAGAKDAPAAAAGHDPHH